MSARDAEARAMLVLRIDDESDIPVVLVRLGALLATQGIEASEGARIATATVELATNIVKYAKRGIIRRVHELLKVMRQAGCALACHHAEMITLRVMDRDVICEITSPTPISR